MAPHQGTGALGAGLAICALARGPLDETVTGSTFHREQGSWCRLRKPVLCTGHGTVCMWGVCAHRCARWGVFTGLPLVPRHPPQCGKPQVCSSPHTGDLVPEVQPDRWTGHQRPYYTPPSFPGKHSSTTVGQTDVQTAMQPVSSVLALKGDPEPRGQGRASWGRRLKLIPFPTKFPGLTRGP